MGALFAAAVAGCFVDPGLDTEADTSTSSTSAATSSSTGIDCPEGQQGCACVGDACEAGLACVDGVCEAAAVCGDWVKGAGEECDDGNLEGGDLCTSACLFARCGDGFVHDGVEACDDGNEVVGDGCNPDCVASGSLRWAYGRGGPNGGADAAYSVAIDGAGNVLVAGATRAMPGAPRDLWAGKLSPAGALVWEVTIAGPENLDDFGTAVAASADGDVIVGGVRTVLTNNSADAQRFVARLAAADGALAWSTVVAGPVANGEDSVRSLVVDADQTIVVAGRQTNPDLAGDFWYARWSLAGEEIWTRTLDGGGEAGANADLARGVAISPTGLVLCGTKGSAAGSDAWVIATDGAGEVTWTATFDAGEMSGEYATACAVNPVGTTYVTVNQAIDAEGDFWLLAFASDGTMGWKYRVGEVGFLDVAHGVAVTAEGDVVVVGGEPVLGLSREFTVRRYGTDGQVRWRQTFGGAGQVDDLAYAVAADPLDGALVVAGERVVTDLDLWVAKLAP